MHDTALVRYDRSYLTLSLISYLIIYIVKNNNQNKSFLINTVFSCTSRTYVQAKDIARARAVYKAAIAVIPNKTFTFGKIWILSAHLEVRQKDLSAARKILGMAIGEECSLKNCQQCTSLLYIELLCMPRPSFAIP